MVKHGMVRLGEVRLGKVMEAEGIIDPLDVTLWEGVRTKAMVP